MQLYNSLSDAPRLGQCALTIGTFDGAHLGHQALLEVLREAATVRGLPVAVLTFADMPYCYFNPTGCPRLLTLRAEKNEILGQFPLDILFNVPFDAALAQQSAPDFTRQILAQRLGLKLLVAGPDFALGRERQGDIAMLRALGQELGFEVLVLKHKVLDEGEPISSTRIREAVESGDVTLAQRLLGRPFTFSGQVISGQQLGRTIGVPTINLQLDPRKVVAAHGIYAARAFLGDDPAPYRAALSIGSNPTVNGTGLNIEFHVIGEDIPTPPAYARLELVTRLRDEQKFPDLPTLITQMQRDIAQADDILAGL